MGIKHSGFRTTTSLVLVFLWLVSHSLTSLASEVILTSENLNSALKQIQLLQQGLENADNTQKAENHYQIGLLAKELASVLSEEVALYDSQQGGLIQLGLDRSRELGVNIDWFAEKKRFFYDGKDFVDCLQLAPEGSNAGECAYLVLDTEFIHAVIDDAVALNQSAQKKIDYLKQYPEHAHAAEVGILLAIDYRDLWRLYRAGSDTSNETKYRDLTRKQFLWVTENHAKAKQAKIADGLLKRFETEIQEPAVSTEQPPASE